MKKIFAITFICSILSISTVFAKNITVLLNNTAIAYTQQPMLKNNTTCVPMKQTAEALGATVSWNVPTKTAIARKENIIVSVCENSKHSLLQKEKQQIVSLCQHLLILKMVLCLYHFDHY